MTDRIDFSPLENDEEYTGPNFAMSENGAEPFTSGNKQ